MVDKYKDDVSDIDFFKNVLLVEVTQEHSPHEVIANKAEKNVIGGQIIKSCLIILHTGKDIKSTLMRINIGAVLP